MTVELEWWQLVGFLTAWACSYWKQARILKLLRVLVAIAATDISMRNGVDLDEAKDALTKALK